MHDQGRGESRGNSDKIAPTTGQFVLDTLGAHLTRLPERIVATIAKSPTRSSGTSSSKPRLHRCRESSPEIFLGDGKAGIYAMQNSFATIAGELADGTTRSSEVYARSGYYGQSTPACFFSYADDNPPGRRRWSSRNDLMM